MAGMPGAAVRDQKSQQTQAQVNPPNLALGLASGEQPGRGVTAFILCDFLCQPGLHSPGRTAVLQTGKHDTGINRRLCLREKLAGGLEVCQASPYPVLIKSQMEIRTSYLQLSQLFPFLLVSLTACS